MIRIMVRTIMYRIRRFGASLQGVKSTQEYRGKVPKKDALTE